MYIITVSGKGFDDFWNRVQDKTSKEEEEEGIVTVKMFSPSRSFDSFKRRCKTPLFSLKESRTII